MRVVDDGRRMVRLMDRLPSTAILSKEIKSGLFSQSMIGASHGLHPDLELGGSASSSQAVSTRWRVWHIGLLMIGGPFLVAAVFWALGKFLEIAGILGMGCWISVLLLAGLLHGWARRTVARLRAKASSSSAPRTGQD